MKLCPKCGNQFPDDANFCPVDAGRLEQVQDKAESPAEGNGGSASSALAGRFVLGERLGGRLTGEIYEATDTHGDRACVVKLVDPNVFPTPLLLQRTERELKQLERLEAIGVAKVLDHGKRDGQLWIASERVDGRPLEEVIASDGPMSPDQAARVVLAVGQALADAAKLGVIHRDLAPKNLLLGTSGSIKIINFGVAVPATDRVHGVPEYVAPEQIEGKPVDQRSNIYSLGALYYFMLTGTPPYTGDVEAVHRAHLDGNPPALSSSVDVPPHVEALVNKALERSSSKRYMTLRQLLGQLEGIIDGSSAGSTQPLGRGGGTFGVIGGQANEAEPSGTLLGVAAFPPGSGARDHAATIPMAGAPASSSEARAPELASRADNGRSSVQVDDDAATRQLDRVPVSPSDDTAPSPALGQAQHGARPASQSDSSASGKRGNRPQVQKKKKKKSEGKFRETMWFKKGELDEAAAEAAAQNKDALVSDKADEIPIEDRYADDGTLTSRDQERLSLRTGGTQGMTTLKDQQNRQGRKLTDVSEKELVKEMHGGRVKYIIAGAALVIVVVIILIVAN